MLLGYHFTKDFSLPCDADRKILERAKRFTLELYDGRTLTCQYVGCTPDHLHVLADGKPLSIPRHLIKQYNVGLIDYLH
jgi:hypothetical protein